MQVPRPAGGHEHVSVLRQMSDLPDGGLVALQRKHDTVKVSTAMRYRTQERQYGRGCVTTATVLLVSSVLRGTKALQRKHDYNEDPCLKGSSL